MINNNIIGVTNDFIRPAPIILCCKAVVLSATNYSSRHLFRTGQTIKLANGKADTIYISPIHRIRRCWLCRCRIEHSPVGTGKQGVVQSINTTLEQL